MAELSLKSVRQSVLLDGPVPKHDGGTESSGAANSCWCCAGLMWMAAMQTQQLQSRRLTGERGNIPDRRKLIHRKNGQEPLHSQIAELCDSRLQRQTLDPMSWKSVGVTQNRIRIQMAFCNLFFPVGWNSLHGLFEDSRAAMTIRSLTAADRIMIEAGDALCTLQLAISSSDRPMLFESMRMYGQVLRRFQLAIERTRVSQGLDSLIAAVYFLLKCESFLCPSWSSPGWMQHTQALVKLINAVFAADESPGAGRWAFLGFSYIYALSYGLCAKKSLPYAPWTRNDDSPHHSPHHIALRVPASLEALEIVRKRDRGPDRTRAAVREALKLQAQLQDGLFAWSMSSSATTPVPPCSTVSIDVFPEFMATIGPPHATLFPSVYYFSDFSAILPYRTVWNSLIVLGESLLKLRRERWYLIPMVYLKELDRLDDDMEKCADDICRIMPYCCQPFFGGSGRICLAEPLYHLEQYYERIGAMKHLAWCQAVREKMMLGSMVARLAAPPEPDTAPSDQAESLH